MWYQVGADILLGLHFLWIAFLVLGLPLGLCFHLSKLRLLHLVGLILALGLQLTSTFCPLTILEEDLRGYQQPEFTYRGSFIITYIEKLVYPGWISQATISLLTVLLVGLTLVSFIYKPVKFKH